MTARATNVDVAVLRQLLEDHNPRDIKSLKVLAVASWPRLADPRELLVKSLP